MRAAGLMSCLCLQGHACMCWKPLTEAGGCAGVWAGAPAAGLVRRGGVGWGGAQSQPNSASYRFRGCTGLLPAVTLQHDGLGTLLSRPWLHHGADGAEGGEGKAHGSPRSPQAVMPPPPVPARPPLSAIQGRCCTITRQALQQGAP